MGNGNLEIAITGSADHVATAISINGKESRCTFNVNALSREMISYLNYWILSSFKETIFNQMPFNNVFIYCDVEPAHSNLHAILHSIRDYINSVITQTNNAFTRYEAMKNTAQNHQTILFYTYNSDMRLRSVYEYCKSRYPVKIFLKTYPSGWNSIKRTWEKTDYKFTIDDLVNLIGEKQIKRIVLTNYYVYETFLREYDIYLPAFLEFIGVEDISVDADLAEIAPNGTMVRSLFTRSFSRLSPFPYMNAYWDKKYRFGNVHYVPVVQHYERDFTPIELEDDYSVLVLSNSRLEITKPFLPLILFLLDNMQEECIFQEINLWFLSLRKVLLRSNYLDDYTKSKYCMIIFQLFYSTLNFLKYEIIDSVDCTHTLLIYGDSGWDRVFPEYYQSKHLDSDEIKQLHQEKRYLYLLMANVFSYLEVGGPIADALSQNLPFINYSALSKTKDFNGFRHIEYNNKVELNHLIKNIQEVYKNKELYASLGITKEILIASQSDMTDYIVEGIDFPGDKGEFIKQTAKHNLILDDMIAKYTIENAQFLSECARIAFGNEMFNYPIHKSRYANRGYLRRILHEKQSRRD